MAPGQRGSACITGASSGIGAAFADRFAAQGLDLILVGRRQEKLQAVADTIAARHGVEAQVVIAELAADDELARLCERVGALAQIEVLVNNAGFGAGAARFDEGDFATHEAMLKVHALATMRLTHAALPAMIANGRGSIVNVASLAGFYPFPRHVMYASTKAFVTFFSEALSLELHGTGVRVQALCPGFTRTDFHTRMGLDPAQVYRDRGLLRAMTPEEVVDASLRGLARDEVICVPGFNNRLAALLPRLVPRRLLRRALRTVRE
jgi:short-subunit dehydrogenase